MNDPALIYYVTDPILPLDAQMGVWPLLTVPPDLQRVLFGPILDPATGTPGDLPLFAIIEGTRIPALSLLIEQESLEYAGLFQGKVAEDLGDNIPVLVRLPQGSRLLRMLLTDMGDDDAPTGMLPKEAAIFIRSSSPLAALRGHFRHFTQLPTDEDRRIYFRFWEPASAAPYFDYIVSDFGQVAAWFGDPRSPIASLVMMGRTPDGWLMHQFIPSLPNEQPRTPVVMTAGTREVLRLARYNANVLQAVLLLRKTFPDEMAQHAPRKLRSQIDRLYRRLIPLGFHSKKALFMLATWEVFYGPIFETRDPDGHLAELLMMPGREDDRIDALRARIEALPSEILRQLSPTVA